MPARRGAERRFRPFAEFPITREFAAELLHFVIFASRLFISSNRLARDIREGEKHSSVFVTRSRRMLVCSINYSEERPSSVCVHCEARVGLALAAVAKT